MAPSLEVDIMEKVFGIQGYCAESVEYEGERVVIRGARIEEKADCPRCGGTTRRYDHTLQDIIIGTTVTGRSIALRIVQWRVTCEVCGAISTPENGVTKGKRRHSRVFGSQMVRYTEAMDNEAVGRLLGISASTVRRVDKDELSDALERYREALPALGPETLNIDETAHKSGHNYSTIVSDHRSGRVLWLEEGRTEESLMRAYAVLGNSTRDTSRVVMDFWEPYERVTRRQLPRALIIPDRFHLARMVNRAIETERRLYQRKLAKEELIDMKKQARWVLLKRPNNLSAGDMVCLNELKTLNEPLYTMYLLKEELFDIFDRKPPPLLAKDAIIGWIVTVQQTAFAFLKKFARSLWDKLNTVLNWFSLPVSNGKAEGINNVIKALLRRAYGYRDYDYFRLKVLQKCGMLMNYVTHTF